MPRAATARFHCRDLEELSRQLLFAPASKRIVHAQRAERLHDEIDPDRSYPLDFIVYRITGYRRDASESLLLVGEAVRPDLRFIIDRLTRSAPMPLDQPDEPMETAAALAARLAVSTKTVQRWRAAGLRWRWAASREQPGKRIVFTRSAVRTFIEHHGERVERAGAFTQIPDEQRQRILDRARRIAQSRNVTLNQVAAHLAKRTGRALETIRLILEKHEREHADDRIFINRSGPLTARQKRVITRAHAWGVPVHKLAQRFGRTRSTIYRAIHERRAAQAKSMTLTCVMSPMFQRDDADAVILRPMAAQRDGKPAGHGGRTVAGVKELPEELWPLYQHPPLNEAQQRSAFIRYNYLKYKAVRLRERFDDTEPRSGDLDQFEHCVREARRLRDMLVRSNLPTVLSVARRHLLSDEAAGHGQLIGLLEVGQAVLIETVETFNATRGISFNAHLTNRLLRRYASASPEDHAEAARRANRRLSGEQMRERLMDHAAARGVRIVWRSGDLVIW